MGDAQASRDHPGTEDVIRKQWLPDRVELRPSQREDVAVQFKDNDSVGMSEDDRASERTRKTSIQGDEAREVRWDFEH